MADERIQIEIQNDGLEASIRIAKGQALERDAIEDALVEAGVCFGIDENVKRTAECGVHDEKFELPEQTIARGQSPRDGKDGALEFDVEVGTVAFTRRSDGTFDWFERNALTRIRQGEDFGHLRAPTEGRPGKTVDGDETPATPGREVSPVVGDGVEVTDEGRLVALRSGALVVKGDSHVDVVEHVEHTGDVDMKSGNLRTRGSLTITGSVNDNFEVRAGGDLIVKGDAFGGQIDVDGNVQIGRGIHSGDRGFVDAGGDLAAHHAQMATLRSGGQVVIATDSIGNTITARRIEVGKRLFGGSATAETCIQSLEAGAPSGAGTKLRVAEPYSSPRDEARRAAALNSERRNLSRSKGAKPGRDSGRHARKKNGRKAREGVAIDRKESSAQRDRATMRRELMQVAEVCILGRVNSGVRIRFGSRRLDVDRALGATRFHFDSEQKRIIASPI